MHKLELYSKSCSNSFLEKSGNRAQGNVIKSPQFPLTQYIRSRLKWMYRGQWCRWRRLPSGSTPSSPWPTPLPSTHGGASNQALRPKRPRLPAVSAACSTPSHTLPHSTKALHFTSRSHSHCLYSKPPWRNSKLNFIFNISLNFLHCQQHHQQQSHHSHLTRRNHGLEKWHVVSHGTILSLLQTHQEKISFLIFLCIFNTVSNITIINLIINLILLIIMVV